MAARRKKTRKRPARRAAKPSPGARPKKPRAKSKRVRRARAAPRVAKPRRKAAARPRRAAEAVARPRAPAHPPLVAGAPIEVGVVLHYYAKAAAGVVALSRPIHRGDTIHVRGATTDFVQPVEELRLDGAPVAAAAPSQEIGLRLVARARAGDRVYRVSW
jgi:putative protease